MVTKSVEFAIELCLLTNKLKINIFGNAFAMKIVFGCKKRAL